MLPSWVSVTVVLVLLGDFSYNILFVGAPAYPTNIIIGGLLGAYAGINQLLKNRGNGKGGEDT